jgi:2-methylcitrate dehydratase PrpD
MEKIFEFIKQTEYDQIPKEAITIAKRCIIDTIGVTLAGSKQPEGKIITEFAMERKAVPEAYIIAGGFKASSDLAALANGTMAHALDYDDISIDFLGHPSTVLVPTVLAIGESRKKSGKDILCSFVVGFEIGAMIGSVMGVQFFESNWHPTPIVGIIAATAAGAKILGLNAQQSRMAFGIASSMAGGLKGNFGTMTKPLHAGSAARNSILALLLANKGFTANKDILEDKRGFFQGFLGERDSTGKERNLGKSWSIIEPGVKVKPYPCCGGSFGCIDAMLELKKRYNFLAEDIVEIECRISPTSLQAVTIDFPKTAQESRFSLRYVTAIALLDGEVSLKQFSEQKVNSPLIRDLMSKIKYSFLQDLGRGLNLPQEVMVKLKNGSEYTYRVEKVKGTAGNPLSDNELASKFRDCASFVLNSTEANKVLELLYHLEELENIIGLMELIGTVSSI